MQKLTPMLQQYFDIKKLHQDKILLFRMGDFYETFFEDAKIVAKILGITLTTRNKKDDSAIPLAGFPYHSLENYLPKLIEAGQKIVICEQTEDPKLAKGLIKREIVDIITPGSIADYNYIKGEENNYLTSFFKGNSFVGLASLDISTGDFIFTQILEKELKAELNRLSPKELVFVEKTVEKELTDLNLDFQPVYTHFEQQYINDEKAEKILKEHFSLLSLEGIVAKEKSIGIISVAIALAYIKNLKKDNLSHLDFPKYYDIENFLQIDEATLRNLEILKTARFDKKAGSLLSVLDKTKTPMGQRLLKNWLLKPLVDIKEINKRHDIVDVFKEKISYTLEIRKILSEIGDISRILSKIAAFKITPRETYLLSIYLDFSHKISELLNYFENCAYIDEIANSIQDYSSIIKKINEAISSQAPNTISEGNIIKKAYNKELDELKDICLKGKSYIAKLEEEEKTKTGINSLKIRYNKVFGYYIEITKSNIDKVPQDYIRKQTLVNCERFISQELKEYEAKVLGAEERIKSLEYELFCEIKQFLFGQIENLKKYSETLALIDVLSNFTFIAYYNNYCRPTYNFEGIVDIKDSRHPVIEDLFKNEDFIPNNYYLNNEDKRILLITGPNMAGKSTYLRQLAVSVLMGQAGSFIPASFANIPIFDKLFTRVGASDNLSGGQSTFLVEMLETANILNSASEKSLILLDEIGRGTSTFDGISLAWAIVEHLHNHKDVAAKTIFATHYHELTELETLLPGVKNYNAIVKKQDNKIIFLRKIEKGKADQSYGIAVAALAGIPISVIKRAKSILRNLEKVELSPHRTKNDFKEELSSKQRDIFEDLEKENDQPNYEILEKLKNVKLEQTTPLQAFQILIDLKKQLSEK